MRKITIVIVSPPPLSRILQLLFGGGSEFEVVGTVKHLGSLERQAETLRPELIVASVKPVSSRISRVVASIKQSSPLSRLILICPVDDLGHVARNCGADACLNDEKLAGQLLRTARNLSERPRLVSAG